MIAHDRPCNDPARRAMLALLVSSLLPGTGCRGTPVENRHSDPRWQALAELGVAYVPYEPGFACFVNGATDEQFAAAVPYLRDVGIKALGLQHADVTDRSIDGLLGLPDLEQLTLQQSDFTARGLERLAGLPRIKEIHVPRGQYTADELARVRAALPAVRVRESILGAGRFSDGAASTTAPG